MNLGKIQAIAPLAYCFRGVGGYFPKIRQPYIATTITFTLTVPVYMALNHSWGLTLSTSGVYVAAIAVAWSIWGRGLRTENRSDGNGHSEKNLIKGVLKNREVILLSIAEAGDMWSFQFLTSYLPTYYITEAGLSIKSASNITAVFPIAGIIAGLLCGFWMSKTGRRKPFTWPLHLVTFTGTLLAINGTGFIRLLGLHGTIFLFSFSSIIAAVCTFLMKETGPLAKNKSVTI
ncbi:hypothetical protein [Phosphitispora fastidiosa]|uniref:hypothetical protein n=1 Tax=Phosphitispora fastidiosa TaxID=2837202 RepID=UPI001E3D7C7D|nr:hypothetical protein [Phosphitispora fastidiosa]MBU7005748.1 sugar phosphate permease [Phosphitispora fastidiosa]